MGILISCEAIYKKINQHGRKWKQHCELLLWWDYCALRHVWYKTHNPYSTSSAYYRSHGKPAYFRIWLDPIYAENISKLPTQTKACFITHYCETAWKTKRKYVICRYTSVQIKQQTQGFHKHISFWAVGWNNTIPNHRHSDNCHIKGQNKITGNGSV